MSVYKVHAVHPKFYQSLCGLNLSRIDAYGNRKITCKNCLKLRKKNGT